MDYIFGTIRRGGMIVENVKTVGTEHSDLKGSVSVTRKYSDNHITDNFTVWEKYRSETDEEGRCYDWYVISNHFRYEDRFTPGIGATDKKIADIENAACEESAIVDERLADIENAVCELSEAIM